MADYDHLFKLLIVGSAGCGKSSLLLRYSQDEFTDAYNATIGVEFKMRTIDVGGKRIKLQIWDTAGQERFHFLAQQTITSSYYRGAMGIILCGDVSQSDGFDDLDKWWEEIDKFASPNVPKIVVACKADIGANPDAVRKLSDFCDAHDLVSVTCSAKSNTGIEQAFSEIVKNILEHQNSGAADAGDDNEGEHKKKKKKSSSSGTKTGKGFFGISKMF